MKEITVHDFENKTLVEIFAMLEGKPIPKDIIIKNKGLSR